LHFARSVLSRPYIFTIGILVANLFVFLLMWQSSGMSGQSLLSFPPVVLVRYGAKLNFFIDQQPHQWWRFVTPMFLHTGVIHLAVNMYSLWMLGPYVEKLYGSAKFVFFWVITGIAGVVASYLTVITSSQPLGVFGRFIFKTHDSPSAGASGALFGLIGVLFVFGIKFRNELPEGFKRAFGTGLLPVIVLNLFIGFMGQGFIDNAAHLGGLFSGAALALVVGYRRPDGSSGFTMVWRMIQVACIALVLICFARVAQHYTDPIPGSQKPAESTAPVPDSEAMTFLKFAKAMNDAQESLLNGLKGDNSTLDQGVTGLDQVESPDPKSDQLRRKLRDLLQRAKPTSASADPSRKKAEEQQRQELFTEYQSWKKEYEDWLKASGKDFGQK